jgi:hypothetical protein
VFKLIIVFIIARFSATPLYMVIYRHQIVEQNHNILINSEYFENVAKSIYLGTTATNRNCIHEKIEST